MHAHVHACILLHVTTLRGPGARWTAKGQETVSCNELANGCTRTLTHIQGLLGVLSWLAPGNTDTHTCSNYAPSSMRYAKLLSKANNVYMYIMFTFHVYRRICTSLILSHNIPLWNFQDNIRMYKN